MKNKQLDAVEWSPEKPHPNVNPIRPDEYDTFDAIYHVNGGSWCRMCSKRADVHGVLRSNSVVSLLCAGDMVITDEWGALSVMKREEFEKTVKDKLNTSEIYEKTLDNIDKCVKNAAKKETKCSE